MLGLFFKKYESGSELISPKCDTNLSQNHDSGSDIIDVLPYQVTSDNLVSQVTSAAEALDGIDQEKILLHRKGRKNTTQGIIKKISQSENVSIMVLIWVIAEYQLLLNRNLLHLRTYHFNPLTISLFKCSLLKSLKSCD